MSSPALRYLMGTCYHRDYDLTGGLWGTLDDALGSGWRGKDTLVAEIDAVLASDMDEEALERYLVRDLGSDVSLRHEPGGNHAWLKEIRRRTVESLARRGNPRTLS